MKIAFGLIFGNWPDARHSVRSVSEPLRSSSVIGSEHDVSNDIRCIAFDAAHIRLKTRKSDTAGRHGGWGLPERLSGRVTGRSNGRLPAERTLERIRKTRGKKGSARCQKNKTADRRTVAGS